MIIDVHTHLNNYDEAHPRPLADSVAQLRQSMATNQVDRVLVLTSYRVDEHRPSTRDVVEALEKYPDMDVVAGISFLHYKLRDLREIADYLADGKVKGLKLYPGYEPFYPHDPRCRVIYDLAMEYDVPVMIHSGDTYSPKGKVRYSHPIHIDDVAVDNPSLKLVICHIGNPWIRDCMEVVYKNRNVHADISGLVLGDFTSRFKNFMQQQVKDMILYAGEPRYLLYGTDWPICRMGSYLEFVRSLKLPPESAERILWRNAAELFRLDVGQEAAAPAPAEADPKSRERTGASARAAAAPKSRNHAKG